MYLVLLALGAVVSLTGIALMAAGISIQDHLFDATVVTPGTIALVGGFILIGLGIAVRALLRVEQALAAHPVARPWRPGEANALIPAAENTMPPRRAQTVPKPEPEPIQLSAPLPAALEEPGREPVAERSPERYVNGAAAANDRYAGEADSAPLPVARARTEIKPEYVQEETREFNQGLVAARGNGSGAAHVRLVARADTTARAPAPAPRPKRLGFDSFWPKSPPLTRGGNRAQAVPAAAPPEPPPAIAPRDDAQLQPDYREAPAEMTVLKSGVVDGMAYTLYSDGSIEAQLPQGTLRFGSIAELRNHIEQNG